MILLVSKNGAFYLARKTSDETRRTGHNVVSSILLHDALFVRRAKRIVPYKLICVAKRNVSFVSPLPVEFDVIDQFDPVGVYNRIHSFVSNSDFMCHIKCLKGRIIVDQSIVGGDKK